MSFNRPSRRFVAFQTKICHESRRILPGRTLEGIFSHIVREFLCSVIVRTSLRAHAPLPYKPLSTSCLMGTSSRTKRLPFVHFPVKTWLCDEVNHKKKRIAIFIQEKRFVYFLLLREFFSKGFQRQTLREIKRGKRGDFRRDKVQEKA